MGQLDIFGLREHYAAYLSLMHSLHQCVRIRVNRVAEHLQLPGNERLIECLQHDLDSAGSSSRSVTPADLGEQSWVQEIVASGDSSTDANAPNETDWGVTYVIEGSSMGGVFLCRQAKKNLPDGLEMTFLEQLSENAANRWPTFVAGLRSASLQHEPTIESAKQTFQLTELILEKILANEPISNSSNEPAN
ncbi:biliverdin-producing heme oxygenase [Stieleria sp. JC731]|nr:biliverdin-producing heme oxygenase [Stieleria sp. JC731]